MRHGPQIAVLSVLSVLMGSRPVRPEHAKHLELIEHALHNDAEWHAVLNQQIVLDRSNRPPYQTENVAAGTRDKLRIIDDGLSEVSPLPVLRKVVRDFAWLGSHVAYAAYVLRTALACFTYGNLLEMLAVIERMGDERPKSKNEKNDDGEDAAPTQVDRSTIADAWSTVAMLTDKIAAVDGDLAAITDLSYTLAAALLSGGSAQFRIVGLLRAEFDKLVEGRCVVPKLPPNPQSLKAKFDQLVDRLLVVYEKLNINTMAKRNWAAILNFQIPASKGIKFDLIVNELLKDDEVGKRITEKMNKMKEPSFLELYANAKEKEEKKEKKKKKGKEEKKEKNDEKDKKEKEVEVEVDKPVDDPAVSEGNETVNVDKTKN